MTHPYFCYIHQGLYVEGEDDRCYHEQCVAFALKEVRPAGIHMAGFGGSEATGISRKNSEQFHKDMYAYKDAHDQGVVPDQVTQVAAEAALKQAEAAEHGTN